MTSPYPFRGAVRWAVLPSLIVAAGAVVSMIEDVFQPGLRLGPLVAAAVGAAFVFPVGAALVAGPRPWLAVLVAGALGALSLAVGAAVITALVGLRASFDSRPLNLAAMASAAGLGALSHHLYLRARRRGRAGVAGGVLIYVLASLAAARLAGVLDPDPLAVDYLRRGVLGGLLQWLALVAALKVGERQTPS